MTLPLSFGFGSCHKVRMDQWSPKKKLNVRSMQQLSWKMMVHGVFTGKGSKSTKYSWHSMQCTLVWGTWNLKIRYIANVISCGFATPRDSAEIDILLKALLVPVWTVTCSYIILCMQQLHQYASLSSKVSVTAFESLPESIVNGNGQAEPRIRIHNMVIWLKWFSQKKHMNWRNIPWLLRLIKPGYRNPSCAQ